MSANELGDIWTNKAADRPASQDTSAPAPIYGLRTHSIDNIELLDDQFGIDPKRPVPDALTDELFGEPAPTKADLAAAGGDADKVPPMNTFAVLDAANVINLPELLANSGLDHECMFIGEAKDELGDVAPWIVHLKSDTALTRNIFTTGKAPWQLWDKNPGMVLRARATCSEMQKHFRKILKVQDDTGKWFYFRFWEGTALLTVAQASEPKDYTRLYRSGMIAYSRHSTPDGISLLKSWVEEATS